MTNEVAVLVGTGSIGVAIGRRTAIGRTLLLADYHGGRRNLDVGNTEVVARTIAGLRSTVRVR